MIRPHRLRPLDMSAGTDVHTGRDLHGALEDGPRADGRVGIDQRPAAEPGTGTDDGPIADHAPGVETRAVGDQRVGTDETHLGDDGAAADTSARQQLRGGGNARRRIDGDSGLGVRGSANVGDDRRVPEPAPQERRASRIRRQPKNPNP